MRIIDLDHCLDNLSSADSVLTPPHIDLCVSSEEHLAIGALCHLQLNAAGRASTCMTNVPGVGLCVSRCKWGRHYDAVAVGRIVTAVATGSFQERRIDVRPLSPVGSCMLVIQLLVERR